MKLAFFEFTGRWGAKALSLLLFLGLISAPSVATAQSATWNSANYGTVFTTPPAIDATNFYNTALWEIPTYSPYTTSHTLNYTNRGTMEASVGWEFDFGPTSSGGRGPSANFFNDTAGIIEAIDGSLLNYLEQLVPQSYLWVTATNIVNKGFLSAGVSGEIVLTGNNINLSRSVGVEITPIVGVAATYTSSNSTPTLAFYWNFWEATNNDTSLTVVGSPWNGRTVAPYSSGNVGECGVLYPVFMTIGPIRPNVMDSITNTLATNSGNMGTLTITNGIPPFAGATTSFTVYSNIFQQAVFVYTGSNTNITGRIGFIPPQGQTTNGFSVVTVQISSVLTNTVTGQGQTNSVCIVDRFAATTNQALVPSTSLVVCASGGFTPSGYIVGPIFPQQYPMGSRGVGAPSTNFFYNPGFSFPVAGFTDPVAGYYTNYVVNGGATAAFSDTFDNKGVQLPAGTSVTNLPGRVSIYANNLNLNQAHLRAEGQIVIHATNLVSSANASMDCENLSFDLGSTNGTLNLDNFVEPSVSRWHGTVKLYTWVWSNLCVTVYPNYYPSNSGGIGGTQWNPLSITNVTTLNMSMTVVDASGIQLTQPVTVQDLTLHSTNIVITDSANVEESLLMDGQSLTLLGNLTLTNGLQDWTYLNAPTLRYFTNNGVLTIPDMAHFGDDGPTNYLAFVNNGLIFSGAVAVNSANIQVNNQGGIFCNTAGFVGTAQTIQLSGAIIEAAADLQFFANSLQFTGAPSSLYAFGALDLMLTNSLSDGGIGFGNTIFCESGFNLNYKPLTGDLLGTAISSYAPNNAEVDHVWAGNNLGASLAGYHNNVAIGSLALIPEGFQSPGYKPLFAFFGATGNNGLYVSNLDLSMLTDYTNEIAIDPSITIYYISVTLNTNVNTGAQTPAQFLNGKQFPDANGYPGGKTQWVGVSGLAKTKPINNYGKVTGNYNGANGQFQLMVSSGAGQSNFVIEASTDLKNWVPLYTNNGPFGTYTDPNAGRLPYRFYRTVPAQ